MRGRGASARSRGDLKRLARAAVARALAFCAGLLVVTLAVLVACGPVNPPTPTHFALVFHNETSSRVDFTVRWAIGGLYVGSSSRTAPPFGDAVVVMGEAGPDLVELTSTALTTSWGPPDWDGHFVFHVAYPRGATWAQF